MYTERVVVADPKGVHGAVVQRCLWAVLLLVTLKTDYGTATGKWFHPFPMYGALGLRIRCGETVEVTATGENAREAVREVARVFATPWKIRDPRDYWGTCTPREAAEDASSD